MKILICCRAIDNMAGGVERMATSLMNDMAKRGHDVSFLSWDHAKATSFYPMNSGIAWHKLDIGDPSRKATTAERIARAQKTRKILKTIDPDIIVCFQDGPFMSLKLYTLGMHYPIILAERNAPSRHDYKEDGWKKHIYFNLYRLANSIAVQCPSYRDDYPAFLQPKITTIPNPVFPVDTTGLQKTDQGQKTILSVGRLSYQKNYSVLIEAFRLIADEHPDWILKIMGEGEDRQTLTAQIKTAHLTDRVFMPGASKNLPPIYYDSAIFCLPSLWEGFPNALAEAMSYGIPATGFEHCAGVRDLINHEENGLLAAGQNTPETLAQSLKTLITDDLLRNRLGKNAVKSMEKYNPQMVYDQWESLFHQVSHI